MIIVTGASSGVGNTLARILLNVPSIDEEIVLVSRTDPGLVGATWIQCDFSSTEDVANLISRIKLNNSSISFLVHCAGVMTTCSITHLSYEDTMYAYQVNVIAPLFITSSLTRQLARGKATVIAISSIASEIHISGELIYSSSKAALSKGFDSLSADLSRLGIVYLTVYPSLIASPMTANLDTHQQDYMNARRSSKSQPDLYDIASYLISLRGSSEFITGSRLYFGGIKR